MACRYAGNEAVVEVVEVVEAEDALRSRSIDFADRSAELGVRLLDEYGEPWAEKGPATPTTEVSTRRPAAGMMHTRN